MFEGYVQDRNQLDIRGKFKAAENLASYKMMVDRMLTVVEKGYWKPTPETLAQLRQTQNDLAPAVATENATIAQRAELQPAPGPTPAPSTSASSPSATKPPHVVVKGRVLEEKPRTASHSAASTIWSLRTLGAGVVALALMAIGWWRQSRGGQRSR